MPEKVIRSTFSAVPLRGGLAAQRVRRAWWMAAPMLLVLAAVGGWPLLRTIWLSLTDSELSRLDDYAFIGVENYIGEYGLLASADWWQAVANTLLFTGLSVSLETSGALDICDVDPRVSRIVDVKPPGSGEVARNRWQNLEVLRASDELKFVLADENDYIWARTRIDADHLERRCPILMSPVHGRLDPAQLAEWILRDRMPVRMQLQLHKLIWGEQPGR